MSDAKRFFPPARWETADEQVREIETRSWRRAATCSNSGWARVCVHVCLPWGVSGEITRRALERTGFLSAFANRMSGRFAVGAGDDPYFLKRLNERHLLRLSRPRPAFVFAVGMSAASSSCRCFPDDVDVPSSRTTAATRSRA
jgi:hypothetical protein